MYTIVYINSYLCSFTGMQNFIDELREDLDIAIQYFGVKNFCEFLKALDISRLEKYYDLIILVENKEETDQNPILLQKAIVLYSVILLYIEDPNLKNQVKFDSEGEWLIRLTYILGIEKLRRNQIVSDYDGFLKSGDISQKMGENFLPYMNHIFKTMPAQEKDRYTKLYGEEFWGKIN